MLAPIRRLVFTSRIRRLGSCQGFVYARCSTLADLFAVRSAPSSQASRQSCAPGPNWNGLHRHPSDRRRRKRNAPPSNPLPPARSALTNCLSSTQPHLPHPQAPQPSPGQANPSRTTLRRQLARAVGGICTLAGSPRYQVTMTSTDGSDARGRSWAGSRAGDHAAPG